MVLFRGRYSVRNEDVIPDISAPRLLRMTAIRNSMRAEQPFIGDKRGGVCGVEEGKKHINSAGSGVTPVSGGCSDGVNAKGKGAKRHDT